MAKKIEIVEVGPRDGLQNESKILSVEDRARFVEHLAEVGLRRIEAGAFVSPEWVPQMADTDKVFLRLRQSRLSSKVRLSALVPNLRGMEAAIASGVREVAIFGACSETFSKRNINCSIEESFLRFSEVLRLARKHKIKVRGYLSTAFGCPYEGDVAPATVVRLAKRMLKLGVFEVSVGDTIGVATPAEVTALVSRLKRRVPINKLAMHFHDTRGTALANVYASLQLGIKTFDASFGGLGGCPYARGASGNLATDDLVYMLEKMKYSTGVNLAKLLELKGFVETRVGRELPGRLMRAGLQPSTNTK